MDVTHTFLRLNIELHPSFLSTILKRNGLSTSRITEYRVGQETSFEIKGEVTDFVSAVESPQ